MLKRVLISALMILGLFAGPAFAVDVDFNGYIADEANILSKDSLDNLNYTLHDLNKKTKAAIAIVTLSTLKGQKIEELATAVMNEYKIGDDTKKNGIVFVIAIAERQLQIVLGDGLVGEIKPKQLENIIDKNVLPYFESGEYENGILRGAYLMADAAGAVEKQKVEHFGTVPELNKNKVVNKNWLWWLILPVAAVIGCIIAFFCVKQKGEQ